MECLPFDIHFIRYITSVKYPISYWDLVWLSFWEKGALENKIDTICQYKKWLILDAVLYL